MQNHATTCTAHSVSTKLKASPRNLNFMKKYMDLKKDLHDNQKATDNGSARETQPAVASYC